jgi:hypothetical protein
LLAQRTFLFFPRSLSVGPRCLRLGHGAYLNELVLRKDFVRVAIQPALTGFRGSNYGMSGLASVLGGMTIGRRVTTQRDVASLACAQVHPG